MLFLWQDKLVNNCIITSVNLTIYNLNILRRYRFVNPFTRIGFRKN